MQYEIIFEQSETREPKSCKFRERKKTRSVCLINRNFQVTTNERKRALIAFRNNYITINMTIIIIIISYHTWSILVEPNESDPENNAKLNKKTNIIESQYIFRYMMFFLRFFRAFFSNRQAHSILIWCLKFIFSVFFPFNILSADSPFLTSACARNRLI